MIALILAAILSPAVVCAWLAERWRRELARDGWFPQDEGGRW